MGLFLFSILYFPAEADAEQISGASAESACLFLEAIERAPQLPRLVLLALVHSTAVLLAAVISSDVGG